MFGGGGGGGRGRGSRGDGMNRRGNPKSQSGPAPTFMPDNILALFMPRPPLPHLPPVKTYTPGSHPEYSGAATYMSLFEKKRPSKRVQRDNPRLQRLKRKAERRANNARWIARKLASRAAKADPNMFGDPYSTLFVARLSYGTTEAKLRREMEEFGPIIKCRIVCNRAGQSRGYAFVTYEREDSVRAAFKHANGRKIDGRYVLTDVERGRTVPNWKPRKLGGGLGPGRRVKARKPRKRDTWFRPYLFNYTVLSRKVKAAIEKATQAAIAAASNAVSSAVSAVQPGPDGLFKVSDLARGGYSDLFDQDRAVALREVTRAKASADAEAAAEAAALLAAAAAAAAADAGEQADGVAGGAGGRRSRSRSPARGDGADADDTDRQRLSDSRVGGGGPAAGDADGSGGVVESSGVAAARPADSDAAALAVAVRVRDDELRPVALPPDVAGAGASVREDGEA